MKKKLLVLFLTLITVIACAFALSACVKKTPDNDEGYQAPHVHDYTQKVVPPTCTEDGYTLNTCYGCNTSFYSDKVPATGHTILNNKCTVCGYDGLWYEEIKENGVVVAYRVMGGMFADYNDSDIVIDTYKDKPVTSIHREAFKGCTEINTVKIGNSVTDIGYGAFYGCTNLKSITLPQNITEILNVTFKNCRSLTSIKIPDSVTGIYSGAFAECTSLKEVTLSENLTKITENAFENCLSLTNVSIPASVRVIEPTSFLKCSGLTGISVNENNKVFYSENNCLIGRANKNLILGCNNSVIPDGVRKIDKVAFAYCKKLESVTIPDSVEEIGDSAFTECEGLTQLTLGKGVKTIGNFAFDWCSFTELVIPDNVISIDDNAFFNCGALESITLGKGLTRIGGGVFSTCDALKSVTVPENIKEIGASAFSSCTGLESLTLHDGLTQICEFAFANCVKLDNVIIPSSVEEIADCVFQKCTALKNVTIPQGVKIIGYHVFEKCGFEQIEIPDSVTQIGERAFQGCKNLKSIIIPQSVTSFGNYALGECNALESATVPVCAIDGLPKSTVKAVEVRGGKSLGDEAFYAFFALESVTISAQITSIGRAVFSNCGELKSITVSADNEKYYSENNCIIEKSSKTLIAGCGGSIPEGVERIAARAFDGILNCEEVIIPEGVTSIGDYAFRSCSFKSITLPVSLTSIGDSVFYITIKLQDIYYSGTLAQWNAISKHQNWSEFLSDVVVHCTDGDVE